MRINHLLKSCFVVGCILGITSPAIADDKPQGNGLDKPNVLFIIVDDLNDYLGTFGGHPQSKTPNIDKLAAQSVQFINAQTNAPVCQSSRNSFVYRCISSCIKRFWLDTTDKTTCVKTQ